ncbi:MAG: ABC transporter ATP-binding protein [Anaerolineales bacterium]
MYAIEVSDLRKYYGATKAVDGVSFEVATGEVFAMLGPNGAGKTTTTEIVAGLRSLDTGVARVLGLNVKSHIKEIKDRIGVQLQTTALYPRLTVREVLNLFRTFFPGETHDADTLIGMMNLEGKASTLTKDLSGGQRQRLSVALALVNKPEVVFLDEPTTGLDPQARRSMWETVRQVQGTGATVFLTTHYMEEAEALCDRVAVMDQGHIIALDTPEGLVAEHFKETAIEFDDRLDLPAEGTFRSLPAVTRTRREGSRVTLFTTDAMATLGGLTRLAAAGTIQFDGLNVRRATLEDVFLKLTGKRIRE